MTLHTVANNFVDIEMILPNDVILFWQDGVILALQDSQILTKITCQCYALDQDLAARGLINFVDQKIKIINISQFVELTAKYYPQLAW